MDDATADGDDGGLGAVGHVEFGEGVGDVKFDGGFGHVQAGGDFLVAEAGDDVAEGLEFARGEVVAGLAGGEFGGDGGGEVGAAGVDDADGFEQFFDFGGFGDITRGTGLNGAPDVFFAFKDGEQDDACIGKFGAQHGGGFRAVGAWDSEVHGDDVGLMFAIKMQGLGAVAGFADEVEIAFSGDGFGEAEAHHGVVVDDEDADFSLHGLKVAGWLGRRAEAAGTMMRMVVPLPGVESMVRVACSLLLRSRMPRRPK